MRAHRRDGQPGWQAGALVSPVRGGLLLLLGAVLWGTTGAAQALGPADTTPLAVGAARLVFGSALLVAWVGLTARVRPGRVVAGTDSASWPAVVVGGGAVAAYQVTFFAAVDVAGVALGTAVAIGSSPALTGLFEWVLRRRVPGVRWRVATAVSTLGVILLAGPSDVVLSGVVLALVAGASYAAYALAGKTLIDQGVPSGQAMARIFGSGGVLMLPVLLASDRTGLASTRGLVMLAWLAAATIVASYLLYGRGLTVLSASTAATLSLAEPLTAAVLGIVVLGERLSGVAVTGCLVIFLGLWSWSRGPVWTAATDQQDLRVVPEETAEPVGHGVVHDTRSQEPHPGLLRRRRRSAQPWAGARRRRCCHSGQRPTVLRHRMVRAVAVRPVGAILVGLIR